MASTENYDTIIQNYNLIQLKDSAIIANNNSLILKSDSTINKLKSINFEAANMIDKQNKTINRIQKQVKICTGIIIVETIILLIKFL